MARSDRMSTSTGDDREPVWRLLDRLATLASSRIDAATLGRSALEALCPALGADGGALYLVDGDELVLTARLGPGLDAAARPGRAAPDAARHELSILQRLSMAIGANLDLASVLEICMNLSVELTGADASTIFIDDGPDLPLRAAAHLHPS